KSAESQAEVAQNSEEAPADTSTNTVTSEEAAVVDAVIDQVANKKQAPETSEEDRKKLEHIEKLVEQKQYFVPIGKFHRRSKGPLVGIITLIVALLIGFLLVLDAGLIDIGITPPTDFLPDKETSTEMVEQKTGQPKRQNEESEKSQQSLVAKFDVERETD